jgi:hypothetical protein
MPTQRHQRLAPIPEYQPFHIAALAANPTPIGAAVVTTIAAAITAGNNVTITPASMVGITKGKKLSVVNGSTQEFITVLSVTGTTFNANFVNSYAINSNLYSVDGAWLSHIVVNKAGSADTLTIYNGLSGMLPRAGGAIAAISPTVAGATYWFHCAIDQGLYYSWTGTAGDVTVFYLDYPPAFG